MQFGFGWAEFCKISIILVILGVRFNRLTDVESKPIQLELHATRFNEETGELDLESSKWVTPNDMPYTKKKNANRYVSIAYALD